MKQPREFPALFMTALFVAASLCSTGCLRQMTREAEPILPSPSYMTDDVQYYTPTEPHKTYSETDITSNRSLATRN